MNGNNFLIGFKNQSSSMSISVNVMHKHTTDIIEQEKVEGFSITGKR
jgi:hypothetical protein